jgi:hypothetical protein
MWSRISLSPGLALRFASEPIAVELARADELLPRLRVIEGLANLRHLPQPRSLRTKARLQRGQPAHPFVLEMKAGRAPSEWGSAAARPAGPARSKACQALLLTILKGRRRGYARCRFQGCNGNSLYLRCSEDCTLTRLHGGKPPFSG